jgi:hypothetical protein
MHQLYMSVNMMFISKFHYALWTRVILFVSVRELMAFQLLFTLEELMADSTLKLPDIIVQLIDVTLQL